MSAASSNGENPRADKRFFWFQVFFGLSGFSRFSSFFRLLATRGFSENLTTCHLTKTPDKPHEATPPRPPAAHPPSIAVTACTATEDRYYDVGLGKVLTPFFFFLQRMLASRRAGGGNRALASALRIEADGPDLPPESLPGRALPDSRHRGALNKPSLRAARARVLGRKT